MAQQVINVGTAPNDGLGDPIRVAYIKCNDNFSELFSRVQTSVPPTLVGSVGDTAGMYAYDSSYFYYCYADYDGSSTIWGKVADTVADYGNANVVTLLASYGSNTVSTTGNITSGNILTSGIVSASGNVTGGNVKTAGLLSATGNVTGGNIVTAGLLSATGNVTGGNIVTAGLLSATGNVQAGNLRTAGLISATGAITAAGATISSTVTLSATTQNITATSLTTGAATIGGTAQTGVLTFGQSTATQVANIAVGATSSGNTKTINIGTQGVANSNTVITVGTSTGNGNVTFTANTTVALANTGGSALSVAGNVTGNNINSTTTFKLAVFANTTVRDSSISSPVPGMMIYVTGTGMQVRGATAWNTVAGTGT